MDVAPIVGPPLPSGVEAPRGRHAAPADRAGEEAGEQPLRLEPRLRPAAELPVAGAQVGFARPVEPLMRRLPLALADDPQVRGVDADPLRLRHADLPLGPTPHLPARAPVDELPAVELAEHDVPHAARAPALPGARGGHVVGREAARDPDEAPPAGDLGEDAPYHRGLVRVDLADDVAHLADVAVAEDHAASHVALLGLRARRHAPPRAGLPAMHPIDEPDHRGVDLARLVRHADAAAAALVGPDLDAGLFQGLDGQQDAPGIAPEARLLLDHERAEGRGRVEGRHQAQVGRPLHILGAGDRIVDVDVRIDHLPALARGKVARQFLLAGDRRGVGLLVALAAIECSDHGVLLLGLGALSLSWSIITWRPCGPGASRSPCRCRRGTERNPSRSRPAAP